MSPALHEGDFMVTTRWWLKLQIGRLVVVRHPGYQIIAKRVVAISDDGRRFLLAGDNHDSISVDQMGWLVKSNLLGVVLFSIKQPSVSCAA